MTTAEKPRWLGTTYHGTGDLEVAPALEALATAGRFLRYRLGPRWPRYFARDIGATCGIMGRISNGMEQMTR